MKTKDFAFVGCRIFALYWGVKAIYTISSLMVSWAAWKNGFSNSNDQMEVMLYLNLIPFAIYMAIFLLFWLGAVRISNYLTPDSSLSESVSGNTLHQAQTVAFSAIAIFILCSSFPEIFSVFYKFHLLKEFDSHNEMSFDDKAQILELSLRLVLGVVLLFGARGLSGMLVRIRELGIK